MNIEEQKHYYDRRWLATDEVNEWSVLRGNKILEYLNSLSLKNPKILDLGCGTGWLTEILSNQGDVTGVDLSEGAIEKAKQKNINAKFLAGNIFQMTLPNQYFDVIVSMEVIEHMVEQKQYLQIAQKCLRSNGFLILSTPNRFVMERMDLNGWDLQPLENWLYKKDLINMLKPDFKLLASTTIIPAGSKGICRYVNSIKINKLIRPFISDNQFAKFKEKAGFGLNIVVMAQKET